MLLFCAPRSQHCSRYVGTSCSPLPFTPRAHLAASPLSLPLVISLGLCHGGRAFGTDQRAFVFDQARTWRTSPHHDACRVLPERRVGLRLPLLWGGSNRDARLGLNFFCLFYRWSPHRERIPGTMRVDVSHVFPPLFTVPCVLVFYPDEQGIAGAAPMSIHGQFRSNQQATVGHLLVPHEMGPRDPDLTTPGTDRITGDDLLWSHQGDAAFTDSREDPPCLRFLEDLIS